MTNKPKILAFAGSLRKESSNKKLIKIAVKGAQDAGAEVIHIDLLDYQMPIFNQDIEDTQGLPENALKIKKLMIESDGFLISLPEYNSSMSAVFKNTIDWASRKASKDEPGLACFNNKIVSLVSASPSFMGGLRSLTHVRSLFSNINCIVLPKYKCIPHADKAFDESGNLKDQKHQEDVMAVGRQLTKFLMRLQPKKD